MITARRTRTLAVAGAIALATYWAWKAADTPMIRPGFESLFYEMFGSHDTLPGDCHWDGAVIEQKIIVARYRCPDGVEPVLTLYHPSRKWIRSARTAQFALIASSQFPPPLLDAVVTRIRAGESAFRWDLPRDNQDFGARSFVEHGLDRLGIEFRAGLEMAVAAVAVACIVALNALFAAWKMRPRVASRTASASALAPAPLAFAAAALALGLAVFMGTRFRFVLDDYTYLELAHGSPIILDHDLRIISVTALFRAGALLGGWLPLFAACNLVMLGSAASLWAYLLRRSGSPRDEALLAAALATFAPGAYTLLRYGSGFQQLSVNVVIFGVLALVDAAARVRDDAAAPWRRALLAAACALAMVGTLVKYPVLVILPVSTWVWVRCMVPDAARSLRRPWFHIGLGTCLAVPLLLGLNADLHSGELNKLGAAGLTFNVAYLGHELVHGWAKGIAAAALALLLVGTVLRLVRRVAGAARADTPMSPGVEAWLGRRARSLGLLALSALWTIPFISNATYVKPYYLVLMVAPLAALAARPLLRAAAGVRPAWLAAVIALPLLVPYDHIAIERDAGLWAELPTFLDAVKRVSTGRAAPQRIVLTSSCAADLNSTSPAAWLKELYGTCGDGAALRWVTGWHDAQVILRGPGYVAQEKSGEEIVLRYCPGAGISAAD
jgi:hypothetical protein